LRDAAEPAIPLLEQAYGRGKFTWPEIRPVAGEKHEFGVGCLPEKKVGKPLLAACPDDEIGIRHPDRIEPGCKILYRHLFGVKSSSSRVQGQGASGAQDFIA